MTRSITLRKGVAIYLLIGSVVCFTLILNSLGFLGFLSYLFPALVITVLYIFIIASAAAYLRNPFSKLRKDILDISLATQVLQFFVLGVNFANYFGPYLGIGITIDSSLNFLFKFNILSFQSEVGYNKNSNEFQLIFNLIPIIILVIINSLEKKEKERDTSIVDLMINENA